MKYTGTENFSHSDKDVTGILLVNLGTPDEPTTTAVRRYLAEFLWDPRVIEVPRPIWWCILHGIILRIRPAKVAHAYKSIWQDDGSPLMSISRAQVEKLKPILEEKFQGPVKLSYAMRYGNPSIKQRLLQLKKRGARRILILPLYPQYSAATSGTVFDAVADELKQWRWLPDLRFISHYPDHELYIDAVANSIQQHQQQHGVPDKLMFSFHGLPKRYFTSGDPYYCECQKTARLVAEKLGLAEEQWQLTFQSRFGREEWLQPYTDKTLEAWPSEGIKHVQVICPGFAADCLETMEEINMQNRELFMAHGGEQFSYIPALNDNDNHIGLLASLVEEQASDWIVLDSEGGSDRAKRAKKLGAVK